MATQDTLRELVRQAVRQALADHPSAQSPPAPASFPAPWTGIEYDAHPSRGQFDILEASTTSTGELVEFLDSKLCSIEKNKPCDHCGMCKTLGF
ncbi:MAG: hypothetical protein ACKVX9_01825 [Blastocatellia bacterium]